MTTSRSSVEYKQHVIDAWLLKGTHGLLQFTEGRTVSPHVRDAIKDAIPEVMKLIEAETHGTVVFPTLDVFVGQMLPLLIRGLRYLKAYRSEQMTKENLIQLHLLLEKLNAQVNKTQVNLFRILLESEKLQYEVDAGNVYMAVTQSGGIPDFIKNDCPYIMEAIKEITEMVGKPALHVMVNRMLPGAISPIHTDTVLYNPTRTHLVVGNNPDCFFWDEVNHFTHMQMGYWYGPIPYDKRHAVGNFGDSVRTHLIVDLES